MWCMYQANRAATPPAAAKTATTPGTTKPTAAFVPPLPPLPPADADADGDVEPEFGVPVDPPFDEPLLEVVVGMMVVPAYRVVPLAVPVIVTELPMLFTAPEAPVAAATPALDATEAPFTPALEARDTALDATEAPFTPALEATEAPFTPALEATEAPFTPRLEATDTALETTSPALLAAALAMSEPRWTAS
ncbi:MAG: hypothetical protein Q9181_003717 [Wetmoreana brouardii]